MAKTSVSKTKEEASMKLTPLGDRVIVRLFEQQEQKKGGIIIPDTAKERPQEGEIVAVGPGRRNNQGQRIEMEVKKGDRVLFGKYAGNEISIADEKYMVMKEDDIWAVL
jgi:chaperonin GroES